MNNREFLFCLFLSIVVPALLVKTVEHSIARYNFTLSSDNRFFLSDEAYNGSVGYNNIFKICQYVPMRYKFGQPATEVSMICRKVWNENISLSWILSLSSMNNCLGYTTNSSDVDGSCFSSQLNYITTCSCNMELPWLCVY